ncbi:PIR Superfamily Protein [Plasmodium ovale wallikeri]|uniref:PIR Superfamily Protein n=1 Tax=Plasmodium ovale wallikeri TaxID=864142 RepID=A0A1A9ALZ7_PLAOA|nr:PIR Superfamily Protein [Plasmodium ovale wallikeri]SBT57759.1 PIR Superfamily Protein [Plasmodium ovale wallikeri]
MSGTKDVEDDSFAALLTEGTKNKNPLLKKCYEKFDNICNNSDTYCYDVGYSQSEEDDEEIDDIKEFEGNKAYSDIFKKTVSNYVYLSSDDKISELLSDNYIKICAHFKYWFYDIIIKNVSSDDNLNSVFKKLITFNSNNENKICDFAYSKIFIDIIDLYNNNEKCYQNNANAYCEELLECKKEYNIPEITKESCTSISSEKIQDAGILLNRQLTHDNEVSKYFNHGEQKAIDIRLLENTMSAIPTAENTVFSAYKLSKEYIEEYFNNTPDEDEMKKIIKLFYKYYNDESVLVSDRTDLHRQFSWFINENMETYNKIADKCSSEKSDDFCKAYIEGNFTNKHNLSAIVNKVKDYVVSVANELLNQFRGDNVSTGVGTTVGVLMGLPSVLFVLNKFTPVGTWFAEKIGKKSILNNMEEQTTNLFASDDSDYLNAFNGEFHLPYQS